MATEAQKAEVKEKILALVAQRFNGDLRKAFEHYSNGDGKVSKSELLKLLDEANIGNELTRNAWARGIIKEFDKDDDRVISVEELVAIF